MRKILALVLAILLTVSQFASAQGRPQMGDRRPKVIVDNDLCGDPDGLFALAHQVLCESANLRGKSSSCANTTITFCPYFPQRSM